MPAPQNRHKSKPQEITITSINDFGFGVGQKSGQIIMVPRTAPGDHILIHPPRTSEKWSSADLIKVISPGPDRIASGCLGFDQGCGGCQWLHLSYKAQLSWKEKNVTAILRTRGQFKGKVNPIVPMIRPEAYRNKLSLKNIEGKLYFIPEVGGLPLAPESCHVQTLALQKAWAFLQTLALPHGIDQIHLRSNHRDEIGMHAFLRDGLSGTEKALKSMLNTVPGLVGIGATKGKEYRIIGGESVLAQKIGGTTWLIPHNGFFQTNQPQAEVLLNLVKKEARIRKTDRVLDLYCGAGFFGLALASEAKEVLGIEENPQSVLAAQESSKHSGISNSRFLSGDMGRVLTTIERFPTEVIIVDPPREGLLPKALEAILERGPRRIVYISCYAPSLARDFKLFSAAGWKSVSCTPVDMFPHTSHVETVLTMER